MIKAMWDFVHVRYLNQKGQGMVEYALILAFVVVVGAIIVGDGNGGSIGDNISSIFNQINTLLGKAAGGSSSSGS